MKIYSNYLSFFFISLEMNIFFFIFLLIVVINLILFSTTSLLKHIYKDSQNFITLYSNKNLFEFLIAIFLKPNSKFCLFSFFKQILESFFF